jgi:hypothetical protein
MTRRDVIYEELERFKIWRMANFDFPESAAHLKYVEHLGWKV